MVKHLVALLFLSVVLLSAVHAQSGGPDDQYVIIYSLMQQADASDSSGQSRQAQSQYLQVQGELQKFARIYPDWNPRIVNFRLNYLAEKIAQLTEKLPVVTNLPPETAAAPTAPGTVSSTAFADLQAQLGSLHDQVQKLSADNSTLQSKLREALGAQPAAIDPRELARAQEKIRSLMKENDLLKVSLSQGKTGPAPGGAVAVIATSDALRQAQQALAEANQKLAEQTARADNLARENQALQSRVTALLASPLAIQALREENEVLKKQIVDLKTVSPTAAETVRLNSELAGMQKQIVALQSAAQVTSLEKSALENRVRQLQVTAGNPAAVVASSQADNEARNR
jgi:hypothetical protein